MCQHACCMATGPCCPSCVASPLYPTLLLLWALCAATSREHKMNLKSPGPLLETMALKRRSRFESRDVSARGGCARDRTHRCLCGKAQCAPWVVLVSPATRGLDVA